MTDGARSSDGPGDRRNGKSSGGQGDVVAFLQDPKSYGESVDGVERIETHAAFVFLAGDRAYKIKRAVRYSYLDFSTLAQREAVCRREVELNRRTAPELYLDVVPIVRQADGTLSFDGRGSVVEWVIVMRRFSQDALFDHLARSGALTEDLCRALADSVLALHQGADVMRGGEQGGGAQGIAAIVEQSIEAFASRPDLFPADQLADFAARSRALVKSLTSLLDQRLEQGFVRQCHGDLHLGNICLMDDRPVIFDCLEFNDRLARIDVLYDLAFLLMDLDAHGLRPHANLVMNRYLQSAEHLAGLATLPLFLSERAAVRAHVRASAEQRQSRDADREALRDEAHAYFVRALAYLRPGPARLVAVGGFSGTGKTTLARGLAPLLGVCPGAIHLRSDVLRKALLGKDEFERLGNEAYSQEMHAQVYREVLSRAATCLEAGQSVVLDAVFGGEPERAEVQRLAERLGVTFCGLWLEAPYDTLVSRVESREHDASDATVAVVDAQIRSDLGKVAWSRLDAADDADQVLVAATRMLRRDGLVDDNSS